MGDFLLVIIELFSLGAFVLSQCTRLTDGQTERQTDGQKVDHNTVRMLRSRTVKTTERIFTKILPHMYLCTRKNWLNFGSHPPPDPDPGIFEGFFNIAR